MNSVAILISFVSLLFCCLLQNQAVDESLLPYHDPSNTHAQLVAEMIATAIYNLEQADEAESKEPVVGVIRASDTKAAPPLFGVTVHNARGVRFYSARFTEDFLMVWNKDALLALCRIHFCVHLLILLLFVFFFFLFCFPKGFQGRKKFPKDGPEKTIVGVLSLTVPIGNGLRERVDSFEIGGRSDRDLREVMAVFDRMRVTCEEWHCK